jgi:hypothetical protein
VRDWGPWILLIAEAVEWAAADVADDADDPINPPTPTNSAEEGAGPEDVLGRRGKSPVSVVRLARQVAAAEKAGTAANGVPFGHGISVTTPAANARLARDPSDAVCAARRALEEAGFEVRYTPTKTDTDHHTVQLPKPVTAEVADLFNRVFGRK